MNSIPREVTGAQLLDRAVAILQALKEAGPNGATLASLVTALELKQSTAHRILSSMEGHGLVDRDEQTKRYRIGLTIVALAASAVDNTALREVSRPALIRLAAVTGSPSYLTTQSGLNAICLDRQSGSSIKAFEMPAIGSLSPMGTRAASQVLLAFMPAAEAELVLKSNARLFGAGDLPREELVRRRIRDAKEQFYVVNHGESSGGRTEIATPVLSQNGSAIAALAISVASARPTKDSLAIIASLLIDEAKQITSKLDRLGR
jgi:DNA-binding IclR family transcriptional regulator